jgi:hypothetical protein
MIARLVCPHPQPPCGACRARVTRRWAKAAGAVLALLSVFFAQPGRAQSPMRWTPTNVAMATGTTGLIVADCRLTRSILRSQAPGDAVYVERNPFLGNHPSPGTLNTMCGLAVLTTWFVGHQLRAKDRKWWFGAIAAVETFAVIHNLRQR